MPTMHIKNSDFSGYSGSVVHLGHRQICDLTTLKGCKFGYFDKRSEIACSSLHFHMLIRCRALEERKSAVKIKTDKFH